MGAQGSLSSSLCPPPVGDLGHGQGLVPAVVPGSHLQVVTQSQQGALLVQRDQGLGRPSKQRGGWGREGQDPGIFHKRERERLGQEVREGGRPWRSQRLCVC